MNRFEVVNIITYWKRSAQSNESVAWILRDHVDQKDIGYTFEEAWELIREFGAINAQAKLTKVLGEVKSIVPVATTSFIHDKKWKLKYEQAKDLQYSPSCLSSIKKMVVADEKLKIKQNKDKWQRSQKELVSTWKTHEKILRCVDLAHKIKKARNLIIYVGSSVWNESGVTNIYSKDLELKFNNLEEIFSESITSYFEELGITNNNVFQYIEKPYVFEFLDAITSINKHTQIRFEVSKGVFQEKNVPSSLDLVLMIGANGLTQNHYVPSYFLGSELVEHGSQYNTIIHGPITSILKEIELHFVTRGRMLCDVCGEKVTQGVGGSSVAPVTIAICYSCSSHGAEPYSVIVTKYAFGKKRSKNYQPGPYFNFVITATLDLLSIPKEQFENDVMKQIERMKKRKC